MQTIKSQAQLAWLRRNQPDLAAQEAAQTPNIEGLPQRIGPAPPVRQFRHPALGVPKLAAIPGVPSRPIMQPPSRLSMQRTGSNWGQNPRF